MLQAANTAGLGLHTLRHDKLRILLTSLRHVTRSFGPAHSVGNLVDPTVCGFRHGRAGRRPACFFEDNAVGRKRPGTKAYERYARYKRAKTVAEFYELGGQSRDLAHDLKVGLARVGAAASDEPLESDHSADLHEPLENGEASSEKDSALRPLGDDAQESQEVAPSVPESVQKAARLVSRTHGGRSGTYVSQHTGWVTKAESADEDVAALGHELIQEIEKHDAVARNILRLRMRCASFADKDLNHWLQKIQVKRATRASCHRIEECAASLMQFFAEETVE